MPQLLPFPRRATAAAAIRWWGALLAPRRSADARLIPIVVGLVLIVGLTIAATTSIYLSRKAEISRAERELARTSLTLAEQTAQMIRMADQILGSVTERYAAAHPATFDEFRRYTVTERMHELLSEKVRDTPNISAVTVITADGYMVNFSRWWPVDPVRVDDRSYFVALRDNPTAGPFISEPVRNRATGDWTIFLARRLNGPHGEFFGILLAALDTGYFESLYARVAPGRDATISMFRRDGTLLARYPNTDSSIGRSYGESPLFRSTMANADHGIMHTDASAFDGLARIMTPHAVPNYPLIINVTNTTRDILSDWRRQSAVIAAILIAGVLLIVLSICLVVRHMGLQQKINRSEVEKARAEEAQIAAEKANAAKTTFLANMSHELRTPLNAIIGFAEMTRDALIAPLDARYRDYASDIASSGQHLLNVINDVLDIAKADVGKLKIRDDVVDVAELIEKCRRLFMLDAERRRLVLETATEPGLPAVHADPLRLKQAILNLVSNAVKFSSAPGHVSVTAASRDDGAVIIQVSDTGIGMTEDEALRALQPFQQIDNSMSRRYDGVGLGLPITKTLVELHGGTLTIQSTPARGTTATIVLPAARVIHKRQPEAATG